MLLRGRQGALWKLVSPAQSSLTGGCRAALSREKWKSSLGSGFDGGDFSDEDNGHFDKAQMTGFGYGEPGSVTLKGDEDAIVDEFNKVHFHWSWILYLYIILDMK